MSEIDEVKVKKSETEESLIVNPPANSKSGVVHTLSRSVVCEKCQASQENKTMRVSCKTHQQQRRR